MTGPAVKLPPSRATRFSHVLATSLLVGCGGGAPLLHPARTLASGDVRFAGGVAANVAVGSIAGDLRAARESLARDPQAPGPPGTNPTYARGALVVAALAPGLSPFVGARVGVGSHFEGGLSYTGRGIRVDMRRGIDRGQASLSVGLGLSATLSGRARSSRASAGEGGDDLPNVDLASLRGYGFDIPLLAGWESLGGIYKVWAGARGGFERDVLEAQTSEPRPAGASAGLAPLRLEANRSWAGAVAGIAMGFNHVHVALELSTAYQVVRGTYNDTSVKVQGLTLAPATALWWSF